MEYVSKLTPFSRLIIVAVTIIAGYLLFRELSPRPTHVIVQPAQSQAISIPNYQQEWGPGELPVGPTIVRVNDCQYLVFQVGLFGTRNYVFDIEHDAADCPNPKHKCPCDE